MYEHEVVVCIGPRERKKIARIIVRRKLHRKKKTARDDLAVLDTVTRVHMLLGVDSRITWKSRKDKDIHDNYP